MSEGTTSLHRLDGLVAVVTGAAQGLGLGIAEQLACDGAGVVMADVRLGNAQASAQKLREQGLNVQPAHLDISASSGVTEFSNRTVAEFGRLDILVNNAGVGQDVAPVVHLTDQEWARVLVSP